MGRSYGNSIADSLNLGLGYAERLLKDIPEDQFARWASPGGQTIESNHPAFILGHLALYAPRIVNELGGNASSPDGFEAVFSKDAKCVDDADGSVYPGQQDIQSAFFDGYRKTLEALRSADDEVFQAESPHTGRFKELFPTVGSAHAFYVGGHLMMHMGQLSAWRRMMGLGAA